MSTPDGHEVIIRLAMPVKAKFLPPLIQAAEQMGYDDIEVSVIDEAAALVMTGLNTGNPGPELTGPPWLDPLGRKIGGDHH